MEMLNGIGSEVPERAKKLAAAFWPGPLTMVMPRGPEVSDVTCATTNFRVLSVVLQLPMYSVPSRMVLARSPVMPPVALIRLYVPALQLTLSLFSSSRLPFTVRAPFRASRGLPFTGM